MPRESGGIQYAAASPYPSGGSGILGRPAKPGDDSSGCGLTPPRRVRSSAIPHIAARRTHRWRSPGPRP
ncbi:hypothetical protein EI171_19245 [Bradyrhizobium sp. LCT2]|nr:hypothetical protein EI171_19245 [Bradyrhizobium sp. LCT2]